MPRADAELDALKKAYAAGTLRVSFEGRSVEYGSAADLLSRRPRILPEGLTASMNWIDRTIGAVAPGAALRRVRQRQALGLVQRAYEGARTGRRTDGWVTAGSGAIAEIASALSRLRERSRDLVRNNPNATRAVHALVSNLVGTGIVPRARARRSTVAKAADQLWLEFASHCDADGPTDFGGLQALVVRTMAESGEVLIQLRDRQLEVGLPVPLQLLEPDHLDSLKSGELSDGGFVVQGIEFDALGRRHAGQDERQRRR